MNPSPLKTAVLRASLLFALTTPIATACVIPPEPGSATPPRSQVMQADARALAYGSSASEILNNPQLSDKVRALFGADWSPPTPGGVGKPTGAAPEYFEVGGPVRMVQVGDANYIAVTGCAKRACAKQRGLLLIREGGDQLLARLDEGGFLHQYAYGPGMTGGSAAAGATLEGALTALERLSGGNPYPRPAP
jgi:hypothetical protein